MTKIYYKNKIYAKRQFYLKTFIWKLKKISANSLQKRKNDYFCLKLPL